MALDNGLSATELLEQFDNRNMSAVEYAQDVIAREEAAAYLNAVSHFDSDLMLCNAQLADEARKNGKAGALCGLPVVAKDNINTVSFPTTGGTRALKNNTPVANAGVVTAIEAAGGYIGGKSGMHELAFGITSNNAVTGPIRNPHNPDLIPGGSSGGTASAVGAGIFPVGLGTDTGASVRLPAALCGVVGFRPTVGRYATDGIIPISQTRDTAGPMAHSVADIALIDGVLAGQPAATAHKDMSDVVLGLPKEVFFDDLEDAVEAAVRDALAELEKAGAKLMDVSVADLMPLNEAVGFPVALYEVMRELPEYLAKHAPGVSFKDLVAKIGSPDVAGIIRSQMGDEAMPEAAYRAAMDEHRPTLQAKYAATFANHGLTALVFPTSPLCARPIGSDDTVSLNGANVPTFPTFIRNTDLGSNIAVPGVSLPCPVSSGLPVGIEFEGLAGGDTDLLSLAFAVEATLSR
ncbi:indoleacetamide hydrolase [Tateyamaria sp.]|uniref:indoleacetamide hydrolase n=1 Tax=Tateyamaria sp. TaxID=1929288 RepID=UPI0032A094EC